MALRLAPKSTVTLPIGEDGDYIEVREDISRRQFNTLLSRLPTGLGDGTAVEYSTASSFSEGLFEAFVVGWTATDAEGEPIEVSVENYNELAREAASAIDSALADYFNGLTPDREEADKSVSSGE